MFIFLAKCNFPKKKKEKEFCYWFGKGLIQCMFNIPPIGVKDQKNWTFLIFRHYIVSWLSAVGPVVGLKLPLEYGKLCVSWQPFLGVQYWSHSIYRNKNVVCIWSVTNQMCIRMWNMNTCFCWKIVYGYPGI